MSRLDPPGMSEGALLIRGNNFVPGSHRGVGPRPLHLRGHRHQYKVQPGGVRKTVRIIIQGKEECIVARRDGAEVEYLHRHQFDKGELGAVKPGCMAAGLESPTGLPPIWVQA